MGEEHTHTCTDTHTLAQTHTHAANSAYTHAHTLTYVRIYTFIWSESQWTFMQCLTKRWDSCESRNTTTLVMKHNPAGESGEEAEEGDQINNLWLKKYVCFDRTCQWTSVCLLYMSFSLVKLGISFYWDVKRKM